MKNHLQLYEIFYFVSIRTMLSIGFNAEDYLIGQYRMDDEQCLIQNAPLDYGSKHFTRIFILNNNTFSDNRPPLANTYNFISNKRAPTTSG